ncbi:luciferase family protein [Haloferax sp. S1W]|uniref:luciferase domain-containing protein n=1 Tax=Haloferax sp. S1W TaxID=3377110 RepID=UPI0037CBF65F
MTAAIDRIVSRVLRWPGVETEPHRFGGTEFVVAGKEIGHVHDTGIVDLAITKRVRDILIMEGVADAHHVLPNSAWVTYRVLGAQDITGAMRLLRLAYLWRLSALRRRDIDLDPTFDAERELRHLDLPVELDTLVRDTFGDVLNRRAYA